MSEYISLPILLVALIPAAAATALLVIRWVRFNPFTKPCPEECGAKKVRFEIRNDDDYVIETLGDHTPHENERTDTFHQCPGSGSEVRKLRPRYCNAATSAGRPLSPNFFRSHPPYAARSHDPAWCRGERWATNDPCPGVGRPTSLAKPQQEQSEAA